MVVATRMLSDGQRPHPEALKPRLEHQISVRVSYLSEPKRSAAITLRPGYWTLWSPKLQEVWSQNDAASGCHPSFTSTETAVCSSVTRLQEACGTLFHIAAVFLAWQTNTSFPCRVLCLVLLYPAQHGLYFLRQRTAALRELTGLKRILPIIPKWMLGSVAPEHISKTVVINKVRMQNDAVDRLLAMRTWECHGDRQPCGAECHLLSKSTGLVSRISLTEAPSWNHQPPVWKPECWPDPARPTHVPASTGGALAVHVTACAVGKMKWKQQFKTPIEMPPRAIRDCDQNPSRNVAAVRRVTAGAISELQEPVGLLLQRPNRKCKTELCMSTARQYWVHGTSRDSFAGKRSAIQAWKGSVGMIFWTQRPHGNSKQWCEWCHFNSSVTSEWSFVIPAAFMSSWFCRSHTRQQPPETTIRQLASTQCICWTVQMSMRPETLELATPCMSCAATSRTRYPCPEIPWRFHLCCWVLRLLRKENGHCSQSHAETTRDTETGRTANDVATIQTAVRVDRG